MNVTRGALGVLLLVVLAGLSYAAPPDQPYMEAARDNLLKAKTELQVAEHNKGGHRAKALGLVNTAISEVNKGISFAREHNHTRTSSFVPVAPGDQPHMQAALDYLTDARKNLDNATPDKGGHRAKAIDLVNQAIAEVNLGIAAGT